MTIEAMAPRNSSSRQDSTADSPVPVSRPPSIADAVLVSANLIRLLGLSYWLCGKDAASGPNQIALTFAALAAGGIAHNNGMPWVGVQQAVVDGASSGLSAIFILLAVGALIGTWALGGTIVAMTYYGLDLLWPDLFYASTLVICAFIAVAVGSSWMVVGPIGVGLMGVAANLGLSPEIAAGDIVSGAFFGDRTSPLLRDRQRERCGHWRGSVQAYPGTVGHSGRGSRDERARGSLKHFGLGLRAARPRLRDLRLSDHAGSRNG